MGTRYIKWFNAEKGFGFIDAKTETNVFVNIFSSYPAKDSNL